MVLMSMNGLDPVTESMMRWIQQQADDRRTDYELARRYYNGDHDTALTDRLKKFLPPRLSFRDNFMDVVVDTLAERMNVIGFDIEDEDIHDWAWNLWNLNRMDYTQGVVHTEAIMLGDSYILCDWDQEHERPRWTHQLAEMIIPHYSEDSRRIDWASKKWVQRPRLGEEPETRLNLYFPDRVEKYVAKGGVWGHYQDDQDEVWPAPWLDKSGQPLGVPFIHFRNRPMGSDFGISEILNVMPMQDLLNKTLIDLTMILDTLAFPQRYTLNVNHGSSRLDILPGSVTEFHSEYDGGQVGQWSAANVDGPLKAIESLVQHIAGTTRTPQHLFQIMGGAPSGEALKTAESGLVQKAKQRMISFGNAWEDCIILALRVQEAFGSSVRNVEEVAPSTTWGDPETRNEQAHLESLKAKAELGISKHQIWRELGYTQEQIDQMDIDGATERQGETNIGAEILRNFQAGEL
ncbi:hypothetical protein [uncultured Mediterranean phage uvDeep-CGR0-KM14-C182]|nr:hypothetical protein [uncultured Mediterranean phage uvDeep-CGR0-KM14-C182]